MSESPRAGWAPSREIGIVAGTPPGGALDRTARALADAIAETRLLDVPVRVVNIPGDGARKAWAYMDGHVGDPHIVSISHPNLTTDFLVGLAAFHHGAYTPLALLYSEYIAFVARSDSPLTDATALVHRLATAADHVTVALSTALGNPNHIALAYVTRHAGGDVRAPGIRVFDSALDAVADVIAGHSDVGAVTAASVLKAMTAGEVRVLAVSAPQRLGPPFELTPTWQELGVPCTTGAWRGVTGAAGIGTAHVEFWQRLCRAAVTTRAWREALERYSWAPDYLDGDALLESLDAESRNMRAILGELSLLKRTG